MLFSLPSIALLKRELRISLPGVKSSHRVEAMARGLGWETNAALLVDLRSGTRDREPNQDAFVAYLHSHGFPAVSGQDFVEAVARVKAAIEVARDVNHSSAEADSVNRRLKVG